MSKDYYDKLIDELLDEMNNILDHLEVEKCVEKIIFYNCMLTELNEMIYTLRRIIGLY